MNGFILGPGWRIFRPTVLEFDAHVSQPSWLWGGHRVRHRTRTRRGEPVAVIAGERPSRVLAKASRRRERR